MSSTFIGGAEAINQFGKTEAKESLLVQYLREAIGGSVSHLLIPIHFFPYSHGSKAELVQRQVVVA